MSTPKGKVKLTKREEQVLQEIARHTQAPTKWRTGYSKRWTPITNERLAEKGLIEYVEASVVLTDNGLARINTKQ